MNDKGRTLLSTRLRAAAKIDTNDDLFAQVIGEGVILIESKTAVRNKVHASALGAAHDKESTQFIREARIEDVLAEEKSWALRDEFAKQAAERDPAEVEAAGEAMLRALGL